MKIKLLFQGDSITDAGRDRNNPHDLGQGYPKYAAAILKENYPDVDFEFIDLGISGDQTKDLVARLQSDFVDVQPDVSADKLYIRATEKKQEEIRRFLIEAGETSLRDRPVRGTTAPGASLPSVRTAPASIQGSGSLRTIYSDTDLREAVEEAQRSWGLPNPVRVVNEGQEPLIQTRENPDGAGESPAVP